MNSKKMHLIPFLIFSILSPHQLLAGSYVGSSGELHFDETEIKNTEINFNESDPLAMAIAAAYYFQNHDAHKGCLYFSKSLLKTHLISQYDDLVKSKKGTSSDMPLGFAVSNLVNPYYQLAKTESSFATDCSKGANEYLNEVQSWDKEKYTHFFVKNLNIMDPAYAGAALDQTLLGEIFNNAQKDSQEIYQILIKSQPMN